MESIRSLSDGEVLQLMLTQRITQGIVVRHMSMGDASVIASNIPPLRNANRVGFEFGNDGAGASDLALACVQAILERMDYVGPVQKVWDGTRVYALAITLQDSFRDRFITGVEGDELTISFSKALGWLRSALLAVVREEGLTQADLLEGLLRVRAELPEPLPDTELDIAALNRQLRDAFTELAGEASVLSQFLGMIA